MAVIIFIAASALLITELLSRTKHPKLYCVLSAAAGAAVLLLYPLLTEGALPRVTPYSAALSAVLGVPGAALYLILPKIL